MKTKDMILGPLAKCLPQHLSDCPFIVERVQRFKLVGITVLHDMNRPLIIEAILDSVIIGEDVSTKFSSVVCNCVKVQ